MKSYTNSKGEQTVIAEMVDAHLLNSYAHYKKRMESLKQESFMSTYDLELEKLVEALKQEINKRGLI